MKPSTSFRQELVGVFGDPVAENPTQAMIEAAFAEIGMDWRYLTVEVKPEALGDAVKGARAMNWKGFNCTIPHEVAVVPLLDRLNPAAKIIGAVNCVINRHGELVGDNTDGKGFLQSLAGIHGIRGLRAVILGAGGAARAIAVELGLAHASQITIVHRSRERGEALVRLLGDRTEAASSLVAWEGKYHIPEDTDVVINATPIGLFPDVEARLPVDTESLQPRMIVCDLIPNPPQTRFLRDAAMRGCTVLDGLGMLVNQSVIGIRLWSGREPSSQVMRQALEEALL
jgi:shikimate dehydrogenase